MDALTEQEQSLTRPPAVGRGHCGPLVVRTTFEDRKRVITLYGELDLASSLFVERQLQLAERDESCESVLVDLQALEFIDSAGIELIARARAKDDRQRLQFVIGDSGAVQRILELTGVAPDEAR